MNENKEYCKRIAEEVEAYASGNIYRCPECGEVCHIKHKPYGLCTLPCGCETDVEPEPLTLWDYMADILDMEYTISSDKETVISVKIWVTLGGPNVCIDTREKAVCLYWGSDREQYLLSYDVCDTIDEWAQEMWGL